MGLREEKLFLEKIILISKKNTFDILIGLTFLGLLGLYIYDHYIVGPKSNPIVRPGITKANDILRRKTKIPQDKLNITATSSACTLFLKNSAESSMNDYANEFIDHHVDNILKTCSGAFPALLQQRIDKAILKCKSSTRDNIGKECYSALIEAKTSSVAAIIKSDANPSELDASILLHLIADKFAREDWLEEPKKTLEIIDILLEKEPRYLNGYMAKLKLISKSELYKDQDYKDEYLATLEFVKKLVPNDKSDIAKFEFSLDDL